MTHRVKCFLNIVKDCSTFPFLSESTCSMAMRLLLKPFCHLLKNFSFSRKFLILPASVFFKEFAHTAQQADRSIVPRHFSVLAWLRYHNTFSLFPYLRIVSCSHTSITDFSQGLINLVICFLKYTVSDTVQTRGRARFALLQISLDIP